MKKVFFSFYLLVIAALLFLNFVYGPIIDKSSGTILPRVFSNTTGNWQREHFS
jgi:hypothetical protein